ncbi:MAG: 7-cyano-7-deazaguanine synthase QueC [Gemmatimonadota bacterium]|nr:7-cyano-7-deazaguanine synthase QueC [Gemmatimonadota bacterium]
MSSPAIVLLSGGVDSTTTLAYALDREYDVRAMTFRYGQRHAYEVEAARRIARQFGVRDHVIVDIDLRPFGGSALTSDMPVPKDRAPDEMRRGGIPITYVPARNTIFLSFALAWAEVLDARDIFIGVNALDYSGYPDCRPEYIAAFERMANLATRGGVEGNAVTIHAPLIDLTKGQIIELGHTLGVDYALTTSCYDPDADGRACGHCDACLIRRKGFLEAGISDPVRYAT